jgi:hypothetical protein
MNAQTFNRLSPPTNRPTGVPMAGGLVLAELLSAEVIGQLSPPSGWLMGCR